MILVASWPASVLSPNNRAHWRRKAAARKAQRQDGYLLALGLKPRLASVDATIPVRLEFCPPDRRGRDLDNMLASCKGLLDGIAEAMCVDDKRFRPSLDWGEVCKGGCVRVHL